MKKLLLLSVSLPALAVTAPAFAQDAGQADEEVLTVIGSRVKGRTALDSKVPVDVLQVSELQATPSLDLKDSIQAVSPSFVVERDPISDGASLTRTYSLRGLDSSELIVLINGKRLHRGATLNGGAQSADLGMISANSIKSVSILRDGAAAQYGADAVAGVINVALDDSEGISGSARFSKFYAGDGTQYQIASKVGISLADRGFLTVSASYGKQNHTDRALSHLNAVDHVARYAEQEAHISAYRSANAGSSRADALGDSAFPGTFLDAGNLDDDGNPTETINPYNPGAGTWFEKIGGPYEFSDPGDLNPDTIAPFGIPEQTNFNVTWNSEMEIGENSSVYTFGAFSRRHVKEPFNYRPGVPFAPLGWKDVAGTSGTRYDSQLANGRTGSSFGVSRRVGNDFTYANYVKNFGVAAANQNEYLLADERRNTSFSTLAAGETADADGYILDAAGDQTFQANRNGGFLGQGVHPNGFNPWFEIDSKDIAAYVGFKGEFDNGLTYDISGSFGRNRVDYNISDTINASLGAPKAADGTIDYAKAQTSFYIGALVNIERSVAADFTYAVDTNSVEALNIAFGAEYRSDQYYKVGGEENSWKLGPLAGPDGGLNNGSDGFGGFAPSTLSDDSRHNYALYVDVDTDVTEDFSVGVAARYEDFSDFGDNFSWKIAARYQLIEDLLAFRAAASTGFHAPSIGQINNRQVSTFFDGGVQVQGGNFPAASVAGQIFGGTQLRPEIANNLSAGFILTPGDNTNITIDVFEIKLKDRIGDSKGFKRSNSDLAAQFAEFDASGFPGATNISEIAFFTNNFDTRTRGIEAVVTHAFNFDESTLRLTAAWAHVSTRITKFDADVSSIRDRFNQEHDTAPHKATFTANYNIDAFNIMARARWWSSRQADRGIKADGTRQGDDDATDRRIDKNPGRVFLDLAVSYDVNDQFSLTVGADNILNTFPANQPNVVELSNQRGRQYLEGPGWQGGSYYAAINANF